MRLIRDLLAFIELALGPAAGLVAALAGGLLLLILVARPGCACSTKEKAYQAAMRSDLRNLASAQEQHRAATGVFTVQLPDSAFRTSTGTVLVSLTASANEFEAWMAYPAGTESRCWIRQRGDRLEGPTCEARRRRRGWWDRGRAPR